MKIKIGDIIIIIFVIAITVASFVYNVNRNFISDNMSVVVKIGGEVVDTFKISDEVYKTYETEYGYNILEIKNGLVAINDADCYDQICVNAKRIKANGESLVCLPHKFIVEIIGDKGGEVDAISQ